jgi:hypothetical protein
MSVDQSQLANLRAFGYTEAEARFLYLAAAHSGYFTVRQFLDFTHARSGKRSARFVKKLFALGHASARRYTRRSLVYHLRSRQIYEAIGKPSLRHRREHELHSSRTRLLAFDFILANPEDHYFETAEEKRQYLLSPSVTGVASGNGLLIFGDLDHFFIRVSRPTLQRTLQNSINDITKGESLWVGRIRMDSALFDPSGGSAPPVTSITVTH